MPTSQRPIYLDEETTLLLRDLLREHQDGQAARDARLDKLISQATHSLDHWKREKRTPRMEQLIREQEEHNRAELRRKQAEEAAAKAAQAENATEE